MTRSSLVFLPLVLLATALWMSGCGTSSTGTSSQTPKDGQEHGDHDHGNHDHDAQDHGDHDHSAHDHGAHGHADTAEIAEQLAKLSPEDRAAAEKQKTCPVTGEPLGSMGVPPKVTVDGHELFICCDGCEKTLKKEPEKYLEKLSK